MPKLGADFHAVLTAEQAGYYKPRYAAFEYMLDELDASPEDFVHGEVLRRAQHHARNLPRRQQYQQHQYRPAHTPVSPTVSACRAGWKSGTFRTYLTRRLRFRR
ncbi:hypothetical protein [Streptomyces lincolnensis]|uniref:hypothetical protein n=1 Tax=Streptomyces lincolnensis TaxID=1915 RepID=UPI0037D5B62E